MANTLRIAAACVFVATLGLSNVAHADEPPASELTVRVTAVERLVSDRAEGARVTIEQALDDAHPQVRVAATAALHKLGDPLAVGALERARKKESTAFVLAKMDETLGVLKKTSTLASVRVGVEIGAMTVGDGVDARLANALTDAAYRRVSLVQGAVVMRGDDTALKNRLKQRNIARIKIDGRVRKITRTLLADGTAKVSAEVEFMVLRGGETLRATVTGAAHIEEPSAPASRSTARALERDKELVDAAVESALTRASTYFTECAR